eukprot:c10295_g1_i1 orf=100-792(-)
MAPSSFGQGSRRRRLLFSSGVCLLIALIVCAAPSCSAQQQQPPPASSGLSWRTARSLASSLLHRIANHRLANGDSAGAERIEHILSSFDGYFYFWKNIGSLGWDYLVHYSWQSFNPTQVFDILRLMSEIQSAVAEFLRLPSEMDQLQWISSNYDRVLQLAKASLQKLLKLFDQPGALRNLVLSLRTEIITGDILRDAMQLGAGDLQSLMQVAKDMLQRYYGPSSAQTSEL